MSVIEKLTKEQEAKIPEYLEVYLGKGLSTTKSNRAKAEKAISDSYTYMKLDKPKFIWVESPFEGIIKAAQLANGRNNVTSEEIKAQVSKASYGSFEAYWVSFYAFISEQLPVKKDHLIDIVKEIVSECGVYWTFKDVVVISEKPHAIHMKDKKLHNTDGLALEYPNGDGIFALNGVIHKNMLSMAIQEESNK